MVCFCVNFVNFLTRFLYFNLIIPFSISFGLFWFGLFVHSFSHTCNTGHVNYRLQLYFTTQLIVYGYPHNII